MKIWICLMSLMVNMFLYAQSLELTYSTYLGGSQDDRAHGIACDLNGNVYLTAPIRSGDFPLTSNALQTQNTEMYVASMNTIGEGLVLSTYLGVPGGANYTHGVALDKEGNIYLVGNTSNPNFPTTENAYDRTFHGPAYEAHGDAFVMKLSPDGSEVLYSTIIGGSSGEVAGKIAVDADGQACIVGMTGSSDFPVTAAAFDTSFHGGGLFVAKLNADGSDLIFSTFIGGSFYDGIAVDNAGSIYMYGTTTSTDFQVTDNALSPEYKGASEETGMGDAFLIKLSADGSILEYGSYIGGSEDERIRSIAIHDDGRLTLAGSTNSPDFPLTENAMQNQILGGEDGFIMTLSPELSEIEYSTFLGGSQNEYLLVCEVNDHLVLNGETESSDFPVTANAYQSEFKGSSDQIIAIVDPVSYALTYSTYFGGSGYECGELCVSGNQIYVAGHTTSRDFPLTDNAYDASYNGGGQTRWGGDVFVTRFDYQTNHDPLEFEIGYCSYIGGSQAEDGGAFLNLDANGRAYVMMNTASSNCITTSGAQDRTYNGGSRFGGYGGDIYAAKLNEDGSSLDYGTYVGGTDHEFHSYFSTMDDDGHLYVLGMTRSDDFPTTENAFDPTFNSTPGSDDPDLFVFKLDPSTGFLDWCTYIGGSGWEVASGITLGPDGSVYVLGHSNSPDLFTTEGCYHSEYNGEYEAFVYHFASDGQLAYATFLELNDPFKFASGSIAVDVKGQAWVAKSVSTQSLFTSPDALQPEYAGGESDLYICTLDSRGQALIYATYLGGQGAETGGLKEADGEILVFGNTTSDEFPVTENAFDKAFQSGGRDYFLRFDSEEKEVNFCTFLDGTFVGQYQEYLVLSQGSNSEDLPVTQQVMDVSLENNQNVYVSIVNAQTGQLMFGTYVGGSGKEYANGIETAPDGSLWIGGSTESADLPVTSNALQANLNNSQSNDGFVLQLVPKQNHIQTGVNETVMPKTETTGQQPRQFQLFQNYPNPFNPMTNISYYLRNPARISLKIYNASGQLVETLACGLHAAGQHAAIWHAAKYASGLYVCSLETQDEVAQSRMLLVR